ncbi:hypothetical protein JR316_0009384 [Psilocybe cubensis]|uniref:Uncharacterized protein n=2 Tax=Psilocybe cubensis TaxID=181762 RepID=A0ACB8GTK9_PSICU|nr:hypothetical protein JR316_0009384 [Psilocybe cubensis]KAH9478921.1 hypothetical protein JR316_0009384 [Psilocybe cubensis]
MLSKTTVDWRKVKTHSKLAQQISFSELSGLNQEITPISSKILHDWGRFVDEDCLDFEIYPVTVEKGRGLFNCYRTRSGDNIPADSTDIIPPGDYDFDIPSSPFSNPFKIVSGVPSFKERKYDAEQPNARWMVRVEPEYMPLFELNDIIINSVMRRDHGQCMITGVTNAEVVTAAWLVPPPFVEVMKQLEYESEYKDPNQLYIPGNAITLQKDLADAFFENAIGIDVNDNYRVVLFRDIGPIGEPFKGATNIRPYFKQPMNRDRFKGPDDIFLRAHFLHCLYVNLYGGDITRQYTREVVDRQMQILRLDGERRPLPHNHPLWKKELSRVIYQYYYDSPYKSDDDAADEDSWDSSDEPIDEMDDVSNIDEYGDDVNA